MKRIGLVGGAGPESTLVYYKEINRLVGEKLGGTRFPEFTVDSVNLFSILGLCGQGRFDELADYLADSAKRLAGCGVDVVAFTSVTCHVVYPLVSAVCPVPMISIPETAAEYASAMGYKKVGLLGTIFTMDRDYLSRPIAERGIEVVVPTGKDKERVNHLITTELEYGVVKPETVAELTAVIERMKAQSGIEAVILGCTELPLALNDGVSPVPCIDIMKIHIDKLVKIILEE